MINILHTLTQTVYSDSGLVTMSHMLLTCRSFPGMLAMMFIWPWVAVQMLYVEQECALSLPVEGKLPHSDWICSLERAIPFVSNIVPWASWIPGRWNLAVPAKGLDQRTFHGKNQNIHIFYLLHRGLGNCHKWRSHIAVGTGSEEPVLFFLKAVLHAYDPSSLGDWGRRIKLWAQPGQLREILYLKLKKISENLAYFKSPG